MASVNKLIALLVRKPGLTPDAFSDYWRHRHGPLVATTPDYGKYRTAYVQSHFVRPGPIGSPAHFEGLAAVWLPEIPPQEFAQTSAYRDRIKPDEESFLDVNRTLGVAVREQVVVPGKAATKLILFLRRGKGLDRRSFCEHVETSYVRDVVTAPPFRNHLRGLVVNSVRGAAFMSGAKPLEEEAADCILEWWFDSADEMNEAILSPDHRRIADKHLYSEISTASVASVVAREFVFFENRNPTALATKQIED